MLFQAVMNFLSRLVEIKTLVKGGKVHYALAITELVQGLNFFHVDNHDLQPTIWNFMVNVMT